MTGARSRTSPLAPGYCSSTPNTPAKSVAAVTRSARSSIPSGSARVRSTSRVCGRQSASARKVPPAVPATRRASVIASAAADASSSSDALATSRPVRSQTMVWKLSSASSRPWEISGW